MDETHIKTQLQKYLTVVKNINILAKYILKNDPDVQEQILQELCLLTLIIKYLSKHAMKIKNKKYIFGSESYNTLEILQKEQDEFLSEPPQVVEGAVDCPKCNGQKAFVCTMQVKSGDENTSVFARCATCGHSFRAS